MGAGGKVVILGVVGVFGGSCLLLELKEKLHLSECLSLRAEKGAAGMWPSILLIIIQNQSEHIAKSLSQTSTEHNTTANTLSPDSDELSCGHCRGLIQEQPCQPSWVIQHISTAAPLGIKWKLFCWTPPVTQIHSGHLRLSALSQSGSAVQIHGTSFLSNFAGHQAHNCSQQKASRKLQKELH